MKNTIFNTKILQFVVNEKSFKIEALKDVNCYNKLFYFLTEISFFPLCRIFSNILNVIR